MMPEVTYIPTSSTFRRDFRGNTRKRRPGVDARFELKHLFFGTGEALAGLLMISRRFGGGDWQVLFHSDAAHGQAARATGRARDRNGLRFNLAGVAAVEGAALGGLRG